MFLRGVGLIIAGALLLGHTPVLAESYIRVYKKGVVYYYFGREHPQPRPAGVNPAALPRVSSTPQTRAFIPETDRSPDLWPWLIKAVTRMESSRNLKVIFPPGTPDLAQLRLGKAEDVPGVNFSAPDENIWTGPRYLGRLLTKIAYGPPPVSAGYAPSSRRLDPHQGLTPIQAAQALVREACLNFLQFSQEQQPEWGPRQRGSNRLPEPNQPGYSYYSFPVGHPYSFRNSWGDYRPGGRYHHAVDIFAFEGTQVYAITAGVIRQLVYWDNAGITLLLQGQDGRGYGYMHLKGYAAGIAEGKAVRAGELIAYVGHTGVRWDSPHLHLQVYADHRFCKDELLNPYSVLVQLCHGNGVTDLWQPKIASRRMPAAGWLLASPKVTAGAVGP